jgi:LPS-assembly protein
MREDVGAPFAAARVRVRARLAAGACALALCVCLQPSAAFSQTAPETPLPPPSKRSVVEGPPHLPDRNAHGPIGEDRLSADEMFVEADEFTRSDNQNIVIARGHVLARYQNYTLRAEELIYNTETGQVVANGHAEVVGGKYGTIEYGEHIVLDDKLNAGVVTGFSATQGDDKVSAAAAVRRNEDVNELDRVVFTGCAVCTPAGKPVTPTWSIQAESAIQDKAHQVIVYKNATLKLKGVPIFWSPVFWSPDPSNPRESGLLSPRILTTTRLGFSWEQPYLWVISPSQDLEIRPQINTNVNPLLNFDYRKRFYSGQLEARFGYTYERYFNNDGDKFGPETSHSYILAGGDFNIDNNWRWGFSAEHSSDPTFFDRYDIQQVYEHRGYFWDDTRRLSTQLYTQRQDSNSFISIAVIDFQSLVIDQDLTLNQNTTPPSITVPRDPTTNQPTQSAENQSALPIVAPLIEARWDPDFDILGGRLRAYANGVLLDRSEASLYPFQPIVPTPGITSPTLGDPCQGVTKCTGVSDQQATLGAEWRTYFTVDGLRIEPFLETRLDVFGVESGFKPFPGPYTLNFYPNSTIEQGVANLGVDLSYPLYRSLGAADLILEPMAELILSPKANNNRLIPNEDSQVVDFDETNIFRTDRFPGYDLYEGGPRASVGAMATFMWGAGHDAHVFLGRSFQSETDFAFPPGSGLQQRDSDWIVFASASPFDGFNAWTRQRFDGQTGDLHRSEAGVNWNFKRAHGIFRYLMDDTGILDLVDPAFFTPLEPAGRREEAEAAGYVMATSHWGITYDAIRDLRQDIWRKSEAGILYRDICIDIALVYQRNETNPLGPSSTVLLRLNFPMTGRLGFLNYDTR